MRGYRIVETLTAVLGGAAGGLLKCYPKRPIWRNPHRIGLCLSLGERL